MKYNFKNSLFTPSELTALAMAKSYAPKFGGVVTSGDDVFLIFDPDLTVDEYTDLAMTVKSVDPDTRAPSISTKKMPHGFHFQRREIEFTTSVLNSRHDKNYLEIDSTESVMKFYRADNTEIVSPTQPDLDSECTRTDLIFTPSVEFGMRAAYSSQISPPNQPVYAWAFVASWVPEYGQAIPLPMSEGGFNMEFVDARKPNGVDEDNFVYFLQGSYFHWIVRHPVGFQHRMQLVFQTARKYL